MKNLTNQVTYASLVEQSQAAQPSVKLVPSALSMPFVTLRMRENITSQKQLIALFTHEFSDSIAEMYTQDAMDGAREQLLACQLEYERTLALFN